MNKDQYDYFNIMEQARVGIRWLLESDKNLDSEESFQAKLKQFKQNNGNIALGNEDIDFSKVLPAEKGVFLCNQRIKGTFHCRVL